MEDRINAVAWAIEKGALVDEKDRPFAERAGDLLVLLRENQRASSVLHDKYVTYTGVDMEIMTYDDPTPGDAVRMAYLYRENKDLWVKLREIFNE